MLWCTTAQMPPSGIQSLIQRVLSVDSLQWNASQKLPSVEGNFLTPVTQEQLTSNDTWIRTYKCPATLPLKSGQLWRAISPPEQPLDSVKDLVTTASHFKFFLYLVLLLSFLSRITRAFSVNSCRQISISRIYFLSNPTQDSFSSYSATMPPKLVFLLVS